MGSVTEMNGSRCTFAEHGPGTAIDQSADTTTCTGDDIRAPYVATHSLHDHMKWYEQESDDDRLGIMWVAADNAGWIVEGGELAPGAGSVPRRSDRQAPLSAALTSRRP